MPRYRIFRLAPAQVERYRCAAPRSGPHALRPRHYEEAGEIEAEGPYEAWKRLQQESTAEERPLGVGDALEDDSGRLLLCNFWGFDEASWDHAASNFWEERNDHRVH